MLHVLGDCHIIPVLHFLADSSCSFLTSLLSSIALSCSSKDLLWNCVIYSVASPLGNVATKSLIPFLKAFFSSQILTANASSLVIEAGPKSSISSCSSCWSWINLLALEWSMSIFASVSLWIGNYWKEAVLDSNLPIEKIRYTQWTAICAHKLHLSAWLCIWYQSLNALKNISFNTIKHKRVSIASNRLSDWIYTLRTLYTRRTAVP